MPQGVLTTSPLSRARLPASHLPPPSVRSRQVDISLGGYAACAEASIVADTAPRPHSRRIQPSCDQAAGGVGIISSPSLGREFDEPISGHRVRRNDDKSPSTDYTLNSPPSMHISVNLSTTDPDDLEGCRHRPEARAKGELAWHADWPLLND
jgi:hypothetical protein